MYREITYYKVICDGCGETCRGLFAEQKAADQNARHCGWLVDNNEHLCTRCRKARMLRLRED